MHESARRGGDDADRVAVDREAIRLLGQLRIDRGRDAGAAAVEQAVAAGTPAQVEHGVERQSRRLRSAPERCRVQIGRPSIDELELGRVGDDRRLVVGNDVGRDRLAGATPSRRIGSVRTVTADSSGRMTKALIGPSLAWCGTWLIDRPEIAHASAGRSPPSVSGSSSWYVASRLTNRARVAGPGLNCTMLVSASRLRPGSPRVPV